MNGMEEKLSKALGRERNTEYFEEDKMIKDNDINVDIG